MDIFTGLYLIAILFGILVLMICWDFLYYLMHRERYFVNLRYGLEVIVMLGALITLIFDLPALNDCCSDSALFSPAHRLTVVVLILSSLASYFYSSFRTRIAPPLLEVTVNCLLLIGLPLNIAVGIQGKWWVFWLFGHIPITMLYIIALMENHRKALENIDEHSEDTSQLIALCRMIVYFPAWKKIPILLILCLPVLAVLVGILLLFGQKPDSMIRAFTDTYKHGFSQWDYKCEGVVCGGHFLCTVAAKGHPTLVKPLRAGVRAGKLIKCNRQLLVSNAFEELLEQRLPALHRPIRRLYNQVGNVVHRYYGIFDKAWVADIIYLLMKPLEGIFILTLYLFDRHPENRIAQQYLQREDRALISGLKIHPHRHIQHRLLIEKGIHLPAGIESQEIT